MKHCLRALSLGIATALALTHHAGAQSAAPSAAFEVASVKPSNPIDSAELPMPD